MLVLFFFQAEEGIRDLVRSRGLGDVYKRQVYPGGLPAKYGDVTGGVVAIDTKSYFDLWQQRNSGR